MSEQTQDARYWVESLYLQPHPEGGYFRETYRATGEVSASSLGEGFSGPRSYATGIYYLLEQGDYSAFHRIRSDEMWHFYAGGALEIHMLDASGHSVALLGSDPSRGEVFQFVVPAGVWFASRPKAGVEYALVGCTVSPGFDFRDFELASTAQIAELAAGRAEELLKKFPVRS